MNTSVRLHDSVRADIQRLNESLGEETAANALREAIETVAAFLDRSPHTAGTFVVESSSSVRTYFVIRQLAHAPPRAVIVQFEPLAVQ